MSRVPMVRGYATTNTTTPREDMWPSRQRGLRCSAQSARKRSNEAPLALMCREGYSHLARRASGAYNDFDVVGVARRSPVTRQAQRARAEPPTDPSALAGDTLFTVGGYEPRYSDYMRELSCGTTLMHSRANGFTLH